MDRLLLCDERSWKLTKRTKEERFTKQVKGRRILDFMSPELQRLLREHRKRWEAMLDDYQQRGYGVKRFSLHAASRVVVGLGAESVLETSIRLHRVYGFPIIPASALKGLARSYALWQVAEQLGVPALSLGDLAARKKAGQPTPIQRLEKYFDEPGENRRAQLFEHLKQDDAIPSAAAVRYVELPAVEEKIGPLRAAFGTTASAGKVVFFDAVPADPARLVLDSDVMNSHYSQYYQGSNTPPADYLNPVPIFFLAIAPGSEFLFAVASKDNSLAEKAQMLLRAALCEVGVGAKTAAGYGLWR
jgi:CRISPR-associated protein Cmr6